MAKVGLTCREAWTIFAQNETLKLQNEMNELKADMESEVDRLREKCINFYRTKRLLAHEQKKAAVYLSILHANGIVANNQGCRYSVCETCDRGPMNSVSEEDEYCHCDWLCNCNSCEEDRDLASASDEMQDV